MLTVTHEGDRHRHAINLDKLIRLKVLAILRNKAAERPDQASVEQRQDRAIGYDSHVVSGRVDLPRGHLEDLGGPILRSP